MTPIAVLLAQAPGQESLSVIPGDFTYTLLGWLALYVVLLFTWAITSTNVTMAARKTVGRSVLVRWVAAVAGLIVFVAVPALSARLLLPAALLLAAPPIVHSTIVASRRGTGLARATITGTGQTAFLAYRLALRLGTAAAELSWTALRALLQLDWAKLKEVPALARQALERIRPSDRATEARDVVLIQDSGLPIDPGVDPLLKPFPKSLPERLVTLLREALGLRASEILITTGGQGGAEVRFKIDGLMVNGPAMSGEEAALVARVAKTLAKLNVAAVAHAQDGVFPVLCGDQRSEVFVTTAPSNDRETVVMRIAADERRLVDSGLDGLGIDDATLEALRRLLANREGLVLVAGRPDSGRSSTIYAAIAEAVHLGRSVATVETSLRHRLDHVPQVKPDRTGAAGFNVAIEAALRHDPDVLVVRDVVDREVAELCMRTAVAGRLVIAGVRADDATVALQRLLAVGADRSLVGLTLTGIVAQRLARVLCETCKTSYQPPADLLAKLGIRTKETLQFCRETGCPACRGTGFQGRTGIFELLVVDDATKAVLAGDASTPVSREAIRKSLVRTLQQSAVSKVRHGVTSVQEIARVLK